MSGSSFILDVDAKVTAKDLDKTSKQFALLATNFEKKVGTALAEGLRSGLDQKYLSKFEKQAQKIQFNMMAARTESERKQILANEKAWKEEYSHIRRITGQRLQGMKEISKGMKSAFNENVKGFASGLSSAIGDVVSFNLSGIGSTLEGLGEKAAKIGKKQQVLNTKKGPFAAMGRQMGTLVKTMGKVAMKVGMTVGIMGMLIMAIKSVVAHGQEMNKAMIESGASVGDFNKKGESLSQTLAGVRDAFNDTKRNLEWMQTGKDQMRILGAWQAAGYTIKEMNHDLKKGETQVDHWRKAVETATTYSRLLNMSSEDVAEKMAGYMDDLGLSLDGVRDRFAQVYQVASQSGMGTKKFFGSVLEATSGMSMYNVRLNETAGLLMQLQKILGIKGAEEAVKGAQGPSTRQEAYVAAKKMGGYSVKGAKVEGEKASKALLRKFDDAGLNGKKLTEELTSRGFKIDATSWKSFQTGIGKLNSKGQLKLISALDKMGVSDQMILQVQKSFDTLKAATTLKPEDIAAAMSDKSPQGKILDAIFATKGVISKDLDNMTFKQVAGFEGMQGVSEQQFKTFKMQLQRQRSQHDQLMGAMKNNASLNKKSDADQLKARKQMIKEFGAYVSKSGDLIVANTPDVLDDPDALDEYEKQNKIGTKLYDFMSHQGAATATNTQDLVDQNLEMAKEIAYNTGSFDKVLETSIGGILTDIYDVIVKAVTFFTGTDAEERKNKERAVKKETERLREMRKEVGENAHALREVDKKLLHAPKGSAKRKDLLEEKAGLELQRNSLKGGVKFQKDIISGISGVASTGVWARITGEKIKSEKKISQLGHKSVGGFKKENEILNQHFTPEDTRRMEKARRASLLSEQAMKEKELKEEVARRKKNWALGQGNMSPIELAKAQAAISVAAKELEEFQKNKFTPKTLASQAEWDVKREKQRMAGLPVQAYFNAKKKASEQGKYQKEDKVDVGLFSSTITKKGYQGYDPYATTSGSRNSVGSGAFSAEQEGSRLVRMKAIEANEARMKKLSYGLGGGKSSAAKAIASDTGVSESLIAGIFEGSKTLPRKLRKKFTRSKLSEYKELGLPSGLIKSLGGGGLTDKRLKEISDMTVEQRKAEAESKKERPAEEKRLFKVLEDKTPENIAKEIKKVQSRNRKEDLIGTLSAHGLGNDAANIANQLMSGGGLSDAVREELTGKVGALLKSGRITGKAQQTLSGLQSMQDFVWRPGQAPVRISEKDVLTGAKAGGPIARAGGSGGGKVINHFYNDAKGFLANQAKFARAMNGYT